jgi:1-acyl-sn-glycerol-3-phosphate acyltransferase
MSSVVALVKTTKVFTKMLKYLRLSNMEGANYPRLKNRYMRELISHLRLQIETKNAPASFPSPAIFVCNHISYLDIPLLMQQVPQASLVSKSEVANWPIIGQAAKRVDTVFVKRGCKKSRQEVRETIAQAIVKDGKSIGVFPSGTTKIIKSESWRRGVFEIAQEHGIPVVPLRINYTPLRKAAYIDNDNFVFHL